MQLALILIVLCSARVASDTSLLEVYADSWSGDRVRQLSIRFMKQASDVLECAAAAAKHMLADQLLVFIGGSGAQEPQCILAKKIRCRLHLDQWKSALAGNITKVFVKSLPSCMTTIQHRVDNSTDFYRNWTEYVTGFGQGPHANFWIGLQTLHSLTWPTARSLRVRMKLWNNTEYWADYSSFSVASEADNFRLNISGFRAGEGNPGDSLIYHNGMMFSTFDSDNDVYTGNCAALFKGAWWYNNCHRSNPNGLYYTLPSALHTPNFADGINWNRSFGFYYSLKEFEMLMYS